MNEDEGDIALYHRKTGVFFTGTYAPLTNGERGRTILRDTK